MLWKRKPVWKFKLEKSKDAILNCIVLALNVLIDMFVIPLLHEHTHNKHHRCLHKNVRSKNKHDRNQRHPQMQTHMWEEVYMKRIPLKNTEGPHTLTFGPGPWCRSVNGSRGPSCLLHSLPAPLDKTGTTPNKPTADTRACKYRYLSRIHFNSYLSHIISVSVCFFTVRGLLGHLHFSVFWAH